LTASRSANAFLVVLMKRPYFIDINGFDDNSNLVLFQCFRKPQESSQ